MMCANDGAPFLIPPRFPSSTRGAALSTSPWLVQQYCYQILPHRWKWVPNSLCYQVINAHRMAERPLHLLPSPKIYIYMPCSLSHPPSVSSNVALSKRPPFSSFEMPFPYWSLSTHIFFFIALITPWHIFSCKYIHLFLCFIGVHD